MTSTDTGTIDITNVVTNMQSTFITLGSKYLMSLALAVPGVGPILAWFGNALLAPFINWVLTKLTEWTVMQAFFMNTAIRKASQAIDYNDSVKYKLSLPPTATDEEYANAEAAEMHSFYNFVMVTN